MNISGFFFVVVQFWCLNVPVNATNRRKSIHWGIHTTTEEGKKNRRKKAIGKCVIVMKNCEMNTKWSNPGLSMSRIEHNHKVTYIFFFFLYLYGSNKWKSF